MGTNQWVERARAMAPIVKEWRDVAEEERHVPRPLFEALRALRRELAAEAQVPPYVIFHDAVLREMAAARPGSLAELGEISGVGARKLEAYGDAFLSVIRNAA
jgi:ATP-dependent DNA helicase RecQ